jgi:hypothetical protein
MATAISVVTRTNRPCSQESWLDERNPAMAALLGLAVDQTQAQGAYVYSLDPPAATARLVCWAGLPVSDAPLPAKVPQEAAGAHFERSAPLVLHENAWSDARFAAFPEFAGHRFEGVASIPLLESGTTIGLLNVCRSRRAGLQASALSFLLSLSVPLSALVAVVGASGFEPPTSWSRTRRSSQAEPRPDVCVATERRDCVHGLAAVGAAEVDQIRMGRIGKQSAGAVLLDLGERPEATGAGNRGMGTYGGRYWTPVAGAEVNGCGTTSHNRRKAATPLPGFVYQIGF